MFDKYYKSLVRFAHSYLFDYQEAEDVVQNLFVHLWENAETLNVRQSLLNYLMTSVKNRCLNKIQHLKVKDKYDLLFVNALHAFDDNIDDSLVNWKEDQLRGAIMQLPDRLKRIIELRYHQNKKINEISYALGISENTVKTQLQRGKAKLRLALNSTLILVLLVIL